MWFFAGGVCESPYHAVEGVPQHGAKSCSSTGGGLNGTYLALPMGVQWRPISNVGMSIGDPLEAAGRVPISKGERMDRTCSSMDI